MLENFIRFRLQMSNTISKPRTRRKSLVVWRAAGSWALPRSGVTAGEPEHTEPSASCSLCWGRGAMRPTSAILSAAIALPRRIAGGAA